MTDTQPYRALTYPQSERRAFRDRALWRVWAREYPFLFDPSDVRRAANQAPLGYHFHEWFAAIRLYEETGHHCLLGKYQFAKAHPAKHQTFLELVPGSVAKTLSGRPQGPDLLMYAPDRSDWFFAEVKGPKDRLRPRQRKLFERLARECGKPIRLIVLRPAR